VQESLAALGYYRGCGRNARPAVGVVPAGVAPATLGFAGSWARAGENENQIEEEGDVEHGEADQNPTSPALERIGLAGAHRSQSRQRRGRWVKLGVEWRKTRAVIGRSNRSGPIKTSGPTRLRWASEAKWALAYLAS
jgi:hypothetical protein